MRVKIGVHMENQNFVEGEQRKKIIKKFVVGI